MHFAVGSTNPAKVEPAREVLRAFWPGARLDAVEIVIPPKIGPMPTDALVAAGARFRADQALRSTGADFGIGPEGGVAFVGDEGWLVYVCCVRRRDGVEELGEATRVRLPASIAAAVRAGEELGPLMDKLSGQTGIGRGPGAIGLLTGGLIDRGAYLRPALAAALVPFVHARWYGLDETPAARITDDNG